ncbi:MAG: S1 RNA-binding domain-containing protein, partial [Planctomycetota bacterium]
MVNRVLIRQLNDSSIDSELDSLFSEDLAALYTHNSDGDKKFAVNEIVSGKIVKVDEEVVVVDVGFKSEATIPRSEWEAHGDQPEVGQEIRVLIEELEDESGTGEETQGLISVSKKKADHIIHWKDVISKVKEGEIVTGTCTRKIKGGLLVDIGVNVFLPASQVDIRRPNDIGDYIGRVVQCEVLKIDEARRNIVVSRRSLIEKQREEDREHLMAE